MLSVNSMILLAAMVKLTTLQKVLIATLGSLVYHIICVGFFNSGINSANRTDEGSSQFKSAVKWGAFKALLGFLLLIAGFVLAIINLQWWTLLYVGVGIIIILLGLVFLAVAG